jgi:hypothetical protein
MTVDLTFLGSDIVVSVIFPFLVGASFVMIYSKLKNIFEDRHYRADSAIVESVVLEYTRRLQDYDKAIAELSTKFDIVEARAHHDVVVSQHSSHTQSHVAPKAAVVAVTQRDAIEKGNGTTDYILKLLSERSRTSREVQLAIGRTREHTARLMKRLHDLGAVSRDINTKPFRYSITDAGREMLKGRAEAASIAV